MVGRRSAELQPDIFMVVILPFMVALLGTGPRSRNRTVGAADLRFKFSPTDLEGFSGDFKEKRFGAFVETSLAEDASG